MIMTIFMKHHMGKAIHGTRSSNLWGLLTDDFRLENGYTILYVIFIPVGKLANLCRMGPPSYKLVYKP